jgi:ABC-type spermidine/putrescine transport system permease subunit II
LRTLPKVMWENVTMFVDPTLSAASVVLILISTLLLLASQALQRRRPGSTTDAKVAE